MKSWVSGEGCEVLGVMVIGHYDMQTVTLLVSYVLKTDVRQKIYIRMKIFSVKWRNLLWKSFKIVI